MRAGRECYRSPSGRYSLQINPSVPHGAGPATYTFADDGRNIWSGERDFTLWDARVSDDGIVAGYAYLNGLGGWRGEGDLRVPHIERDGKVRLGEVFELTQRFP